MQDERNSFRDGLWLLRKLDDFSCLASFDCGDEDLNEFFRNDALDHKNELLAEIYSFHTIAEATGEILPPVAFVTFHNDVILLPKDLKKEILPHPKRHYPSHPAVKIGRLGVLHDLQGIGIGSHLLKTVKKFFLQDNRTGCRFITVDAYAKSAKFYKNNGFQFLTAQDEKKRNRTMFFDLKRLEPADASNPLI